MSSLNKATLIGRLGQDPEIKTFSGGASVTNFSIATSEKFKNKAGEQQEKTEWHNIQSWGKLGEICGQYLKKGSLVYIEGRIETREYEDKNNVKKYATSININEMKMLGSKSDSNAPAKSSAPAQSKQSNIPEKDLPF